MSLVSIGLDGKCLAFPIQFWFVSAFVYFSLTYILHVCSLSVHDCTHIIVHEVMQNHFCTDSYHFFRFSVWKWKFLVVSGLFKFHQVRSRD